MTAKYSNASVARHLGVKESDLMHVVERPDSDQLVVILSDYRKLVFPVTALKDEPRPVEPPPGDPAPLPVTASGKVVPGK